MLTPAQLAHHADELRRQGYTIVPDVLSPAEVAEANAVVDAIFAREAAVAAERQWANATFRVAYMLPQKHALFCRLPLNPRVLPLMQAVLGRQCVLSSLNALTMAPGGTTQALHRDHPDPTPGVAMTINALHTLDAFTRDNGATRVVPGSHDWPAMTHAEVAATEAQAVTLEAPAGSLIAFNGALIHAGSANRTTGLRRCLHPYYCRAWVQPQWDYPASLSPDVIATLTPDERMLLGFYPPRQRYDAATDRVIRYRRPDAAD